MFGAPSVVNVVINIVSHAARGLWPLRLTQLAAFGRYAHPNYKQLKGVICTTMVTYGATVAAAVPPN